MNRLEQAVVDVAKVLGALGVPYMVIGGFAVTVWGEPRLTQDVDITIACEPSNRELLAHVTRELPARVADPAAFAQMTRVLPVTTTGGVSVDLILAGLPFEHAAIERAVHVDVGGHPVALCTPEDLIVHKVISERPRDRDDIRGLVRRQGAILDRTYLDPIVEQLAEALAQPDILEFYRSVW